MDSSTLPKRLTSPALRDDEGNPIIRDIRSHHVIPVSPVMVGFWAILLGKCIWSTWAVNHYDMPISSLYVWIPSLFAGVIAHVLWRQRKIRSFANRG